MAALLAQHPAALWIVGGLAAGMLVVILVIVGFARLFEAGGAARDDHEGGSPLPMIRKPRR